MTSKPRKVKPVRLWLALSKFGNLLSASKHSRQGAINELVGTGPMAAIDWEIWSKNGTRVHCGTWTPSPGRKCQ